MLMGVGTRGKGIVRELGMDRYTLLYLRWITNKIYCIAQSYVAAWTGGEFGGEWIHACVCMAKKKTGYVYMYN